MTKSKISIYISEDQADKIKALPRSINMSRLLRSKLDEILAVYEAKRD